VSAALKPEHSAEVVDMVWATGTHIYTVELRVCDPRGRVDPRRSGRVGRADSYLDNQVGAADAGLDDNRLRRAARRACGPQSVRSLPRLAVVGGSGSVLVRAILPVITPPGLTWQTTSARLLYIL